MSASSQQVEQSFERVKQFQRHNSKVKPINAKIMEFIALNNQPFSVVGDVGFRNWSSTGTHYQLRYFSDVALPELHSSSVTAISFTTYYGTPLGSLRVKKDTRQKKH